MEKLKKEQLQPNSVYAVQFVSDNSQKHRGIIMTNASREVWRSWNVAEASTWTEKKVVLSHRHSLYPASVMEHQFAYNTLDSEVQRRRNQKLIAQTNLLKNQLLHYNTSLLHRIAERINRFFS